MRIRVAHRQISPAIGAVGTRIEKRLKNAGVVGGRAAAGRIPGIGNDRRALFAKSHLDRVLQFDQVRIELVAALPDHVGELVSRALRARGIAVRADEHAEPETREIEPWLNRKE